MQNIFQLNQNLNKSLSEVINITKKMTEIIDNKISLPKQFSNSIKVYRGPDTFIIRIDDDLEVMVIGYGEDSSSANFRLNKLTEVSTSYRDITFKDLEKMDKMDSNNSKHDLVKILFYLYVDAYDIKNYFFKNKEIFEEYFNVELSENQILTPIKEIQLDYEENNIDFDTGADNWIGLNFDGLEQNDLCSIGSVKCLEINNQRITLFIGSWGKLEYAIEQI